MTEQPERAKNNKKMLSAVRKYLKVDGDGNVLMTKSVGRFKEGSKLPMVGIKGASLISTDSRSNMSWQKENAKVVKKLFNAIQTNSK
tara:strand:- start:48 stop:308 length:261 start_codon:yes stop_codon:yes gene_type:complete